MILKLISNLIFIQHSSGSIYAHVLSQCTLLIYRYVSPCTYIVTTEKSCPEHLVYVLGSLMHLILSHGCLLTSGSLELVSKIPLQSQDSGFLLYLLIMRGWKLVKQHTHTHAKRIRAQGKVNVIILLPTLDLIHTEQD